MTQGVLDLTPARGPQRLSHTVLLAAYFANRPNVWIDGRALEFAGRYAWRTRVSELRKPPFSMTIENRQRRITREDGMRVTVSEYRYRP